MRNLTVKRKKTLAGYLTTAQVYVEDRNAGTVNINGVPCKKLGKLKKGEEKTFSITEEEVRVYVIADRPTKDICNDCYILGAGIEDVYLSGKDTWNPFIGNPFRFDGVTDTDTLNARKRQIVISVIIAISAILVGIIVGFGIRVTRSTIEALSVKPMDFTQDGLTLTLTDEFKRVKDEDFDFFLKSKEVSVLGDKCVSGAEDATAFAAQVLAYNGDDFEIKTKDDLVFFEYTQDVKGKIYRYIVFSYKASDDEYWLIHFYLHDDKYDQYEKSIFKWANSVEIKAATEDVKAAPKDFTVSGLTLTVTDEFEMNQMPGLDFYLKSKYVAVVGNKVKSDAENTVDFANWMIESKGEVSKVETKENLVYYAYKTDVKGTVYRYTVFSYKAGDGAYWVVQFFLPDNMYDKHEDRIFEWAKTVKIE